MTFIESIPSDLSGLLRSAQASDKELIVLQNELIVVNKEILAVDRNIEIIERELLAKSIQQITELQKLISEQQKLIEEIVKLNPASLIYYTNQFFAIKAEVEGAVIGPLNLEYFSTLSGYLQSASTQVICRAEWRTGIYPAGGFIGQDEWVLGTLRGQYSQFNLPVRGPYCRLKFQGQAEGNATITLQANNFKGLPKYQASTIPFVEAKGSITASGSLDTNVGDITGGLINYSINVSGGGKAAFILYTTMPSPSFLETPLEQVVIEPAAISSYTTQGQLNIPPFPIRLRMYNLGSATQTVETILWQ